MISKISLIFLAFICFVISAGAQVEQQHVYTIGVVPQFEIRHTRKIWNPILSEIKKSTGITIKLVGSPTIPDFESEVTAGKFDFAYMNPYHLLLAEKSQGYIPLIRDHGRKLHGIIVVRQDSSIKTINDLDGKKVAFPSPNALGASLLIRANLAEEYGMKINPIYVKTHSSVYLNVIVKQTAAGGGVQKTLNQQRVNIKGALRVLHKTPKVAPHPIAVHPRVPTKIYEVIKDTFLKLGDNAVGKSLLAKIPIKKVGEAKLSDYTSLYKLKKYYLK